MSGPSRVGEFLPSVLEEAGVLDQVKRARVVDEWAGRVGAGIARVARPRVVDGSTLVVEVRSSAWLTELRMMQQEILKRLNDDGSDTRIESLRFALGQD